MRPNGGTLPRRIALDQMHDFFARRQSHYLRKSQHYLRKSQVIPAITRNEAAE
jgi:hypothetical protein